MHRSAVISDCGAFRYHLERRWGPAKPMLFVMLNPSTADASEDDPTIRKCVGFAERHGSESVEVVNLFAFRATDPRELKRAGYPVGPDNHRHIRLAAASVARRGGLAVCAWGANGRGLGAVQVVTELLRQGGLPLHALFQLADGTPAHPLMLPYSSKLACISGAQSREVA
ncbi:hypothetical protein CF68_33090 [Cupriavidus sp. SK-4]|uniref:DUF1643 domain-containing protein n=1 Tax=Cupriavidus sp. SK-4 TaxID=574750 RepID=UPI000446F28E|nr:DUF1643 domain-containing protein [Cupriavidus sp. SK-4]EYS89479.1 hypothetical protein CF68_33090 [Cupriavidus sp. SK-4]